MNYTIKKHFFIAMYSLVIALSSPLALAKGKGRSDEYDHYEEHKNSSRKEYADAKGRYAPSRQQYDEEDDDMYRSRAIKSIRGGKNEKDLRQSRRDEGMDMKRSRYAPVKESYGKGNRDFRRDDFDEEEGESYPRGRYAQERGVRSDYERDRDMTSSRRGKPNNVRRSNLLKEEDDDDDVSMRSSTRGMKKIQGKSKKEIAAEKAAKKAEEEKKKKEEEEEERKRKQREDDERSQKKTEQTMKMIGSGFDFLNLGLSSAKNIKESFVDDKKADDKKEEQNTKNSKGKSNDNSSSKKK